MSKRLPKRYSNRDDLIEEIDNKQREQVRSNVEAECWENIASHHKRQLGDLQPGSHHYIVYSDIISEATQRGERARQNAANTVAPLIKLKNTLACFDTQTMDGILADKSVALQK